MTALPEERVTAGHADSGARDVAGSDFATMSPFDPLCEKHDAIISTPEGVGILLTQLYFARQRCLERGGEFLVALDCEGMDSSDPVVRQGCAFLTIAFLIGIGLPPVVVLVDVYTLGNGVFDIAVVPLPGARISLRMVLESGFCNKLLWDCRFDNFVLRKAHGISMRAEHVYDLQLGTQYKHNKRQQALMALNAETLRLVLGGPSKRLLSVMSENDVVAKRMWKTRDGGSLSVWRDRPLNQSLILYAAFDCFFMFDVFSAVSSSLAMGDVKRAAAARMHESSVARSWPPKSDMWVNPFYRTSFPRVNVWYDGTEAECDDYSASW